MPSPVSAFKEQVTAVTTGAGVAAMTGGIGAANHFGFVFPDWAWAIYGVAMVALGIVCFATTVHLIWRWLRGHGVRMLAISLMVVGILALGAGVVLGARQWVPDKKPDTAQPAAGAVQAALPPAQDLPPSDPGPPVPKDPAPSAHLARSLTLDDLFPIFTQNETEAVLKGVTGKIFNVGSDLIYWDIESAQVYLNDVKVYQMATSAGTYTAATRGAKMTSIIPTPVSIPPDTTSIVIAVTIHYDTEPKTGLRKSYRKLSYPVTWDGPTIQVGPPRVIAQRED
jgi:hypothetical protein